MNKLFNKQIESRIEVMGMANEEFLARSEISEERYDEIKAGSELTIKELSNISIALEMNMSSLASMIINDSLTYVVTGSTIEKMIENSDARGIAFLFTNNRLVFLDDELYYTTAFGRVSKKVDNELIEGMFDLLLRKGYVDTVKMRTSSKCGLKFKSLTDLDKYGESVKENYIYGTDYDIKRNLNSPDSNLTKNFADFINNLPVQERKTVLEEEERRIKKYERDLEKAFQHGTTAKTMSDYIVIGNDKCSIILTQYDFSKVIGCEEIVSRINEMQKKIKELALKNSKR